jgi:DnaJ homolog subfamily C member 3
MSYYLLPPNPQALQALKQCLHFDPDSKPCRIAYHAIKAFDRDFIKLDILEQASNWNGIIKLVGSLSTSSEGNSDEGGLAHNFDAALDEATGPSLALPSNIIPRQKSPRRLRIYSLMCRAFIRSGQVTMGNSWCRETLRMDENNLDGLIGRGEARLKAEEWADALRTFEQAFEASGRSNQYVCILLFPAWHFPCR